MKLSHFLGAALIVLTALSTGLAQQEADTTLLQSSDVSDQQLEAVSSAYQSIEDIRARFSEQHGDLSEADLDQEEEREILKEIHEAVEAEGLTWARYSQILRSAQEDVVLHDRFMGFLGEEVVVEAAKPRDYEEITQGVANGNLRMIEAREIENMPITSAEEAVGLLPGVDAGLVIRGGGADEVAVRIDGSSMRTGRDNTPFLGISYTLIDQIHVETSGFKAEYGNARSAVINIRTKGSADAPELVRVDRETLERIARAYVGIEELRRQYGLSGDDQELADRAAQRELEFEMAQVIADQRLDVETYVRVVRATQTNGKLREQLFARVDRIRSAE